MRLQATPRNYSVGTSVRSNTSGRTTRVQTTSSWLLSILLGTATLCQPVHVAISEMRDICCMQAVSGSIYQLGALKDLVHVENIIESQQDSAKEEHARVEGYNTP